MKNGKAGIVVAGSVIVDKINEISAYPNTGELTQIRNIRNAVGGCVPNVAIDLKKIAPALAVSAMGKIGNDAEGAYVTDILKAGGVSTEALAVMDGEKTSFTEVMSIPGGQRTFFVYPGAALILVLWIWTLTVWLPRSYIWVTFCFCRRWMMATACGFCKKPKPKVSRPPSIWSAKTLTGIALFCHVCLTPTI